MQVRVNGKKISFSQSHSLATLLKDFAIELQTPGIAVALNERIISRSAWASCMVSDGDEIEVVHAVQGG